MISRSQLSLIGQTTIAFLISTSIACAREGGISSGGGTLFMRAPFETPVLLDFLEIDPNFKESRNPSLKAELPTTRFAKVVGYETLSVKNLRAYSKVKAKMASWKINSPAELSELFERTENAIDKMQFTYTPFRLKVVPEYSMPDGVQIESDQMISAVIYKSYEGARISSPVWDSIGVLTQEGLLVHEALRNLQISGQAKMGNSILQKLTAILILETPSSAAYHRLQHILPESLQQIKALDSRLAGYLNELCNDLQNIHLQNLAPVQPGETRFCSNGQRQTLAVSSSAQSLMRAEELQNLAKFYSDLAFKYYDKTPIDKQAIDKLGGAAGTMLNLSNSFITMSVGTALSDMYDSVTALASSTRSVSESSIRDFVDGNLLVFRHPRDYFEARKVVRKLKQENQLLINQGVLVD